MKTKQQTIEELIGVLKDFPQPGRPGKTNWTESVVKWWNEKGREALQKAEGR